MFIDNLIIFLLRLCIYVVIFYIIFGQMRSSSSHNHSTTLSESSKFKVLSKHLEMFCVVGFVMQWCYGVK